jgi:tyrosinase
MTYIDYSAFDPVFWLHHAMIDRCFAMWQIINPGSYVVPEPATYNTFTNYAHQTQDVNSPLTPFYKDTAGNFWTSDEVRATETFGYAYAETANAPGTNVTSQVITAINNLYGPETTIQSLKLAQRESESPHTSGTDTEWICNIRVSKYALNAPFFIHVFLGPFNPDPSSWSFDPNLVGSHFISVKGASAIANSPCNCDPNQMVSGTIPLTHALMKHVSAEDLKSLDPEDVNPYLAQNLKYRVTLSNDTEVGNGDLPSLKISVISVQVQTPESVDELPTWGEMKGHMDVSTS